MAKDQQLGIRITTETKNALLRAADDESRSASGWCEKVLVEWLRAHGYLTAAKVRKGGRNG